jgi:diamine N-acetyltransferase
MEQNPEIRLRIVEENDAQLLLIWENNTDIWLVTGTEKPYKLTEMLDFIEQSKQIVNYGQIRFIIIDNEKDTPIGTIDLYDYSAEKRSASVGILIAEEKYRGRKYAKHALRVLERYALDQLDLRDIHCSVQSNNITSLALFDSCGYQEVGQKINNGNSMLNEILFKKCLKKD